MANCVEQWGGPASGRRAGNSTNTEEKVHSSLREENNNLEQVSFHSLMHRTSTDLPLNRTFGNGYSSKSNHS
jgi:hypothetical protein